MESKGTRALGPPGRIANNRDLVNLGAPVSSAELKPPYALAGNAARGNSLGDFEICGSRVLYQAVILT